jgi:hypothetical protein
MTTAIFAQYDCDKYHKYNCPRSPDKKFSLNGQSKSAMVQIGVATKLNVIVYRGQDYRISFCSEKKIVGEKVHFQILQKERVPKDEEKLETSYEDILDENGEPTGEIREITNTVVDRTYVNELKVLYDNTQDDLSQEVEFSITSTKRLIIQVIAPGAEHVKMKRGSKQMDIGCVGILIEHMSSPGLGFE